MQDSLDILILSNGPGEVVTWVKPVVKALREQFGDNRQNVRISVVLAPCNHATGKETQIVQSYPEVDRVQSPEAFFPFLLQGKTAENWDWRDRGIVLFLGGDQFFSVVIGKRLGYKIVVYAEWEARWLSWVDQFGVMKAEVKAKIPAQYQHKATVVGDLMVEAQRQINPDQIAENQEIEIIGLLPGSKSAKLTQGLPFFCSIAEKIHQARPQTRFIIPVAPTLDLQTLANYGNLELNPIIRSANWTSLTLQLTEKPYLKTENGLKIDLIQETPAYQFLAQCAFCITTVGANTAELASLAVPMFVLIPSQQLDAMRSWDGLPGILANLPGIGTLFAKAINWYVLQQGKLFAWPNIWAKSEIVPELQGKLEVQAVADLMLDYLEHPEKLAQMRDRLRQVRGEAGAAQKLTQLVANLVEHQS